TPEAEEALRGARTRMARKPPALARELLRNFPKRRARNARRRRKGAKGAGANGGGDGSKRAAVANGRDVSKPAAVANGGDRTGNGRQPGRGRGRDRRVNKSQSHDQAETPSDAVLTEALSSKPAGDDRNRGGELAPAAGEKLQRNVQDALDHAEE
ncbi:MAG: hypothetical protein ACRDK7_06570, partial [Solirubrobacteraceae bacterium]